MTLATWVHDLDPVIFPVWGELKVRWYGLSYLMAFVVGYFVMRSLSRRGLWVVPEEKIGDFLTYCAVFGVFLGGRLGYLFFYTIPDQGWGVLAEDPLLPLKVWEGGMASHGGFLGIMAVTLWFAWKNKLNWAGVGDGFCVAAPIGLLFGRTANFINGELYGRVTESSWGVKFPGALRENGQLSDAVESAGGVNEEVAELLRTYEMGPYLLEPTVAIGRDEPKVMEVLGEFLQPRHCSQLYEAFLEGAVLFAILYAIRVLWKGMPHGVVTGAFFVLYALFRIVVEYFREPDSSWVIEGAVTKGQFYSYFMILIGCAFWVVAFWKKKGEPRVESRDLG